MWRIPCVFPVFLWNKGFSARSFWCFHADAHGFFRGFGGLNPSIIGVEGVFSAGVFFAVFCHIVRYFFHSGVEDVGHGVNSYKKNIGKERDKAARILSDIMGKEGDSRRLFYII